MSQPNPRERIVAIDILRGFALLGILLMNMMSFAMPDVAYFNPASYGGNDPWNRLVYSAIHVLADQKFMALFSLLFGAGVMLLLENLESKGERPAKIHYIRNGWLLAFGLAHSILIWSGDVLTVYALSAFVLYFVRRLVPRWQFTLGLLLFFVPTLLNLTLQSSLPLLDSSAHVGMENYWQPPPAEIEADIGLFRGSYGEQLTHRLAAESVTTRNQGEDLVGLSLLVDFFGRALAMMMMGMACYSWGILTAKRSDRFYWVMMMVGFGVGFPVAIGGLLLNSQTDWHWSYSLFSGRVLNNFATPLVAAGYIGLIMLWSRTNFFLDLRSRLAAVGRTALTNYIGQSIMATAIFYGFGLGLYGSLDRGMQLFVILLIWVVQLFAAQWWLARFRYGPLEWLWRCLTYFRWQPLRKTLSTIYRSGTNPA